MSAWKKASKSNQRIHRERGQLESRQHLGALEKRKDYKLRAKDQNKKNKVLKKLYKKALTKNPDEFYHHMINSKIIDDEHIEKDEIDEEDEHTKQQIALMETQDIKYIRMKRTIETRKIQRLQAELHMTGVVDNTRNKHVFFVSDEKELKNFDVAKHLDTHPALLHRRTNRTKIKDLEKIMNIDLPDEIIEKLNKKQESAYSELKNRIVREKELSVTEQKLELKRLLQQKRLVKPEKLKAATKESAAVYKFQYERKK